MPSKIELKLYTPDFISSLSKPKTDTSIKEIIKQTEPAIPAVKLSKETKNNKAPKILFCEKNKIA